eukprot:6521749-Pyramimonas_sp.AAC.1
MPASPPAPRLQIAPAGLLHSLGLHASRGRKPQRQFNPSSKMDKTSLIAGLIEPTHVSLSFCDYPAI